MNRTKPGRQIELRDGSKIAVVGGGPAGSFFAYFALQYAHLLGIQVDIDVFESKDFNSAGPKGCNNCGGIISESLVQSLSTEGIVLDSEVIRRGIQTYTIHLDQGVYEIETPLQEQRIASMFRGIGPLGSDGSEQKSFDFYLVQLAVQQGARFVQEKVVRLERTGKRVSLTSAGGSMVEYDLVVGAAGLNETTLGLFKEINPAFRFPKKTKTFICEFKLDQATIDAYFSNSMHVFLLDLPKIKFGALIPKGRFVTLVLLGSGLTKEIAQSFIDSGQVKSCFPDGVDYQRLITCKCYPSINVVGARQSYGDNLVLIGDSGSSKLYKNGLGAAYISAKAAARTAFFNGIDHQSFKENYLPVCQDLDRDNQVGKLIFLVTGIIQKSRILKKGLLGMIQQEGRQPVGKARKMSSILWDTFTGSANYRNILLRVVHPGVLIKLAGHIIIGFFKPQKL